jgi:hypothetical protein
MSATAFQRLRRELANIEQTKTEEPLENEKKLAEPTNKELMALLDGLGIEYDKKSNKATLLELLKKAQGEPDGKTPDNDDPDAPAQNEDEDPGKEPDDDKDAD